MASASPCCREGQGDEVDGSCGFHKDLSVEFTTVDCFCRVVGAITDNQEVNNTTTGLDRSQIRLNDILELLASKLVIQLEELSLSNVADRFFDDEEETADVDSVEGRLITQCSLISEEDHTLTRECDDGVNSCCVEQISVILQR